MGRLCERDLGWRVVGEASTAREAVSVILRTRPTVVLLDVFLDDGDDGLAVVPQVREQGFDPRWLVVSASLQSFTLHRARRARVHGYIDKTSAHLPAFAEAVGQIAAGGTYFSPAYHEALRRWERQMRCYASMLSAHHCEVLSLIGRGWTDAAIAGALGISVSTAQGHRSHLLQVLGLPSSPQLVAYAIAHGFTAPPVP